MPLRSSHSVSLEFSILQYVFTTKDCRNIPLQSEGDCEGVLGLGIGLIIFEPGIRDHSLLEAVVEKGLQTQDLFLIGMGLIWQNLGIYHHH